MIVNDELVCKRKWSWPDLKLYPYIFLEGLKRITQKLRMIGEPTEMRTGHLPDSGGKSYRLRPLSLGQIGARAQVRHLPLKSFDVLAVLCQAHFSLVTALKATIEAGELFF
jgi:hypothetical protein